MRQERIRITRYPSRVTHYPMIDFHQVRILTRYALLAEWRQASRRSFGRRKKQGKAWAVWTVIAYLGTGAMLARIFSGNISGPGFETAAALELLILAFV